MCLERQARSERSTDYRKRGGARDTQSSGVTNTTPGHRQRPARRRGRVETRCSWVLRTEGWQGWQSPTEGVASALGLEDPGKVVVPGPGASERLQTEPSAPHGWPKRGLILSGGSVTTSKS